MLSKSCATRTISTSGLQCSSWPGDKWHVFVLRWHFSNALPAIRIRPPSCYQVKAFPKCLLAAHALEHTVCTTFFFFFLKKKLSSRLSSVAFLWCTHIHWAAMFGHRTSDFTSVSLNMYHASQTVCKRSAANLLIFTGKRAMFTLFKTLLTTSDSHVGESLN